MNQVENYVYGKKKNFTLATIFRLETSKKSFELGVNHILPAPEPCWKPLKELFPGFSLMRKNNRGRLETSFREMHFFIWRTI